jgi:ABC-2 type transport system permease protein
LSTGGATEAHIHDIGYRRYDGARLGTGYARRSLFVHSLRGAYGLGRTARSKVLPFGLFAIMCVPAVVMVAVAATTGLDELPIEYTSYVLAMQPIVGLYLALAAPQAVSLDLRYRTIPLYFSRPLAPADYVAAKSAALATALFLFGAVPLTIAWIGGLLAELGVADQTGGWLRGLVATAVFALLHTAVALLVASLTPRRGFGVAAVVGALTIPLAAVATIQEVAAQQGERGVVGWLGLFSPGTLVEGIQAKYLGGTSEFPDNIVPSHAAGAAYLLVIAALIAVCHALLLRRYRKAGL